MQTQFEGWCGCGIHRWGSNQKYHRHCNWSIRRPQESVFIQCPSEWFIFSKLRKCILHILYDVSRKNHCNGKSVRFNDFRILATRASRLPRPAKDINDAKLYVLLMQIADQIRSCTWILHQNTSIRKFMCRRWSKQENCSIEVTASATKHMRRMHWGYVI